jgi:hypothetical protein
MKYNIGNIEKDAPFQIFGSSTSLDSDVMVFVKEIPENEYVATSMCKAYNEYLPTKYPEIFGDREMNCNLAIIKNHVIDKVYKGTEDECNNSLYFTYDNFVQKHPNQILTLIDRDIELKLLRTLRVLLSFLSRTKFRPEVKKALKGDANLKIETLKSIDLSLLTHKDLGKRNVSWEDYLKTMTFQLAQTRALLDTVELYTKEDIISYYPQLEWHITRDNRADSSILEFFKREFLKECESHSFKQIFEYNYKN